MHLCASAADALAGMFYIPTTDNLNLTSAIIGVAIPAESTCGILSALYAAPLGQSFYSVPFAYAAGSGFDSD